MYYFYCPNCEKEEQVETLPKKVVCNTRGGYGTPVYHFECPKCKNLDAGFMEEKTGEEHEKRYYKTVIGIYQNIRGFSNNKRRKGKYD